MEQGAKGRPHHPFAAFILTWAVLCQAAGRTVCGYTFDAGPNAVLLCQKPDLTTLMALLNHYFEPAADADMENFVRGKGLLEDAGPAVTLDPTLIDAIGLAKSQGAVQYMILSKLGMGAKERPAAEAVV